MTIVDITIRAIDETRSGVESAEGGFGRMGKAAAAGLAVAGAAVAGLGLGVAKLGEAFGEAMNLEAAQGKLAAQLGLTAQASEHFGRAAGKLYAGAYGDSMDDVNEALKNVQQNIGDLAGVSDDALTKSTATAMDFAKAFDQDISQVTRAVGTMLRNGLARDAEHAFDILTRGMQNGTNVADDLMDTFAEYSTQFREVGIDGEMAMGLISQAVQAGARDADTAADAIKEFAIRSKDGSATSIEGFQAIGLNAEEMFGVFARGGPESEAAMADVIRRLKEMEDPVAQDAAAVALFGTKAEDLQDALFAMDPTTAVASLGQVGGAAAKMGDDLNNNAATKIESFKRTMKMGLVNFMKDSILPRVVEFGERAAAVFETFKLGVQAAVSAFSGGDVTSDGFVGAMERIGVAVRGIVDAVRPFIEEWTPKLQAAWDQITAALAPVWEKINGTQNLFLTFGVMLGSVVVSLVMGLVVALGLLAIKVLIIAAPFLAVVAVIWGVITALRSAYENFEGFRNVVDGVVSWLRETVPPIFEAVRAAIAVAFEWIMTTGLPFVQQAFSSFMGFLTGTWWPAVSAVWSAIFTVISTVVGAIVAVVLPIITSIVNFISTHMDTIQAVIGYVWGNIQNIISNAWQIISNIIQLALNLVSGNWSAAWENIKNIFGGVMDIVMNMGRNAMNILVGAVSGAVGLVVGWFRSLYDGATERVTELVSMVSGLPGRITSALGNLGSLLVNAGKDVIRGLIRGVENMLGELRAKLRQVTDLIPLNKGPITKDRRLLEPSGTAIMDGLIRAISSRVPTLLGELSGITAAIPGAFGQADLPSAGAGGWDEQSIGGRPQGMLSPGPTAGPAVSVYVQGSIRSDRDLLALIRDELVNLGLSGGHHRLAR